jgi:hypothetical protein
MGIDKFLQTQLLHLWCEFCGMPSSRRIHGELLKGKHARGASSEPNEDEFTKTVEEYTAAINTVFGLLGSRGGCHGTVFIVTGDGSRKKWGNLIAQWVPTWLVIGLYNKVVKLEGRDETDRGTYGH